MIFLEASGCTLIKNSHKILFWPGFYGRKLSGMIDNLEEKWSFGIGKKILKSHRWQPVGTVMSPLPTETDHCVLILYYKWLYSPFLGKIDQLRKDVKKTARINGTIYPAHILDDPKKLSKRDEAENRIEKNKANLLDLFRPRKILIRTVVMFYCWMVIILNSK